jgi:hypothetical protein
MRLLRSLAGEQGSYLWCNDIVVRQAFIAVVAFGSRVKTRSLETSMRSSLSVKSVRVEGAAVVGRSRRGVLHVQQYLQPLAVEVPVHIHGRFATDPSSRVRQLAK